MKGINKALIRQQTFFGMEKAAVMLLFIIVGLAGSSGLFAKGGIYGICCAMVCGVPAFFLFRKMARTDPQMVMVLVRALRYRQKIFPGRGRVKALVRKHSSNFVSLKG